MQWKLIKALNLGGPLDPEFRKIWFNPVYRKWCLSNLHQDEVEETRKFELLLSAINPSLAKHIFTKFSDKDDVGEKITQRQKQPKKVDKTVLDSIKKYKDFNQRALEEDDIILNPKTEVKE